MRRSLVVAWIVAAFALGACHHGGGGGGTATARARSALLVPDDQGFQDAYTHAPQLHADVAAGRWERALDELTYIDRQINTIEHAEDVSPRLKRHIALVRPMIKRLAGQIRQKDATSIHTARALVGAFAAITNDPDMRTWMRNQRTRETYP